VKLRPVSVKSADDTSSSGVSSSDSLSAELSKLLGDDAVNNEVVIDWIDVSRSFLSQSLCSVMSAFRQCNILHFLFSCEKLS